MMTYTVTHMHHRYEVWIKFPKFYSFIDDRRIHEEVLGVSTLPPKKFLIKGLKIS